MNILITIMQMFLVKAIDYRKVWLRLNADKT